MTHLTPEEFVDLLDGRLAAARVAHAGTCPTCRAQAATLRQALVDAGRVEPHEPSPLFWEHFSARVADAIRHEPATPRSAEWRPWQRGLGVSFALAAAVLALVTFAALSTRTTPASVGDRPAVVAAAPAEWDTDAIDEDEAWTLLRSAAGEIEWDDVQDAGFAPKPGSAARAVDTLTADERAELASLLEEELKRSGA
jgi:hypothetical protein